MSKCVCVKLYPDHYFLNKIYECSVVKQGIVYAPYIIAESINIISESTQQPKKSIKSRYSQKISTDSYQQGTINKETKLTITGYNVYYAENSFIYFSNGAFVQHFKTLKQIRKEKLNKLNNI